MKKLIIDGTEIEVLEYNKTFEKAYINAVSKPMPKPLEMMLPILYIKRLKKYYENYEADVFIYPIIRIKISSCNLIKLCKLLYSKNEHTIENQRYYLLSEEIKKIYDYLKCQKSEYLDLEFVGVDGICEKQKLPKNVQEKMIQELLNKLGMENTGNEQTASED